MLFRELSEKWLQQLDKRLALNKIKPASVASFKQRAKHAIAKLGEYEVEAVRNGALKQFAESLAPRLGPKSLREVVLVVKMILQSHVDENGEPLIDLSRWRAEFIYSECPDLDVRKQRRPVISQDEINVIPKNRKVRVAYRVFVALAASTGLRIGEMLSVRYAGDDQSTSWDPNEKAIFVRQSVWSGQEQEPKTPAAVRRVDCANSINRMLADYVSLYKKKPGDYLFSSRPGSPWSGGTVSKHILHKNGIPGAHALRRARARWLDTQGAPRQLTKAWLGHSTMSDITELYLGDPEVEFRRKHVERIGTGLALESATASQVGVKIGRPRKPKPLPDPVIPQVVSNSPAPQTVVYTSVYTPEPAPVVEQIPEPGKAKLPEPEPESMQPIALDDLQRAEAEFLALGGKLEHSFGRT